MTSAVLNLIFQLQKNGFLVKIEEREVEDRVRIYLERRGADGTKCCATYSFSTYLSKTCNYQMIMMQALERAATEIFQKQMFSTNGNQKS